MSLETLLATDLAKAVLDTLELEQGFLKTTPAIEQVKMKKNELRKHAEAVLRAAGIEPYSQPTNPNQISF